MVLSTLILILIGVIAFFHYVQGLFSATLSAMFTILAAVIAVSYHEPLVAAIMKGNLADAAHAIMLVSLFAAVYVVLRLIFDRFVPGNVRYPLIVDKVGAGVMGVVAGIYATGVFAMAVQMLPFGPSVAGYARFELAKEREVRVPAMQRGRQSDSVIFDELKEPDDFRDPEKASSLLIPVDDILINTVNGLSNGGSLAGRQPLQTIHPAWLNELFGQRLGYQPGSRHVTLNLQGKSQVNVESVFHETQLEMVDAEYSQMREKPLVKKGGDVLKPQPGQVILVVRTAFDINASDDDKNMRFSCGAVRLLGIVGEAGNPLYLNYHPIGTMDGDLLYRNRIDDPIIANLAEEGVIDFVFLVNRDDLFKPADPKVGKLEIKDGVFFEAKRMGRVDLSNRELTRPTADKKSAVRRKDLERAGDGKKGAGQTDPNAPTSAAPPATNAPLSVGGVLLSSELFTPINAGNYDGNPANVTLRSGTATVRDQKFSKLRIEPIEAIAMISRGDYAYSALFVPPGKAMLLVQAVPAGDDPWGWANRIQAWQVLDGSGAKHPPNGAWAKVKVNTQDRIAAEYNAEAPINSVPQDSEGRPMDVWLAFNLPTGQAARDLLFEGKSVRKLGMQIN